MDIKAELEKIIGDYKGSPVKLDATTTFDELGFDSLDTVDLIMQVEEKFGITFDDDLSVGTLGDLVLKIGELKG